MLFPHRMPRTPSSAPSWNWTRLIPLSSTLPPLHAFAAFLHMLRSFVRLLSQLLRPHPRSLQLSRPRPTSLCHPKSRTCVKHFCPATLVNSSLRNSCLPRSFCPRCSKPSSPVPAPGCPGGLVALNRMPFRGTTLAVLVRTASSCAVSSRPRRNHPAPLRLCHLPAQSNPRFAKRGPSLQEILAADRSVWQSVHALMRDQSWSLSDSLNEIAFCRQDMSSALQPRPRAQHVPSPRVPHTADSSVPPPPSSPGGQKRKRRSGGGQGANARPKAKTKPSASASAQQVPAAKAFDKTWFKKVNGVETCMRGALGRCKDPNCPRSHLCPVPLPNGKPCAQKHTALDHLSTKH